MAGHRTFTRHCWRGSFVLSPRATATSGYRIAAFLLRGQVLRCQSIGLSSGGIAVVSRKKAHTDGGKWWFQPSRKWRTAVCLRRVTASGDGVERLLAEVEVGGKAMDAKDAAAAYYETMKQVGRMPRRRVSGVLEDDRYGALVSVVRERAPEFNARSMAMVAYISGKAAQKGIEVPRQLLPVLMERAEEICMRMPERELATTMWAFSQNWGDSDRSSIRQAFCTTMPAVLDKISDMSMKGASSILSSYAKVGVSSDELLDAMEMRLAAAGRDASPRQLAMLLWSFSKLHRLPERLVSLIIDALNSSTAPAGPYKPGVSRGRGRPQAGFNNHDLCMLAWSVANHVVLQSQGQELPAFCAWSERQAAAKVLGQERQQLHLVAAVGAVIRRKQQPLDLRSAAVLAWSFARVLHYEEAEFDRIAADARAAVRTGGGSLQVRCQQIAMLLWAFAACGHRDDGLFGDLAEAALELLTGPRPQPIHSNHAFQSADDMLKMSGTLLPCGFTTAGLSMCVWGIATIGSPTHRQRQLLEALAGAAVGHVPCFGAQSLSHLCWGLAVAQCWHRPLWEQLRWAVSCLPHPEPRLFVQIAQAELVLEMEAPWIGVKAEEDLAVDTLLQGMTSVGRTRLQGRKQLLKGMLTSTRKSTRFQTHVASAVMRLGLQPVLEHTDTGHSIDVALLEDKVAIEADGPWHFSRNTLQPLGATLMKWRCLEQLGWKVVSVPFFNWSPYGSDEDPEYQLSYLRQLLIQSGVNLERSFSSQNARNRDDRSAPAADDVDSSARSGAIHEVRRPERPPERRDNVQVDSGLVGADAETAASRAPAPDSGVDERQPGEGPGAPALKTRAALLDRVAAGRGRLSRANVLQREAQRRIVRDPDPLDESNG